MAIVEGVGVPTLADVAERAGVSKATASKALADRYGVSERTRERVKQAARELRFTPNLLARGLGGGRTQTIGMITTDLDGRFAPKIMTGVEDALGADRSSVILCNSRGLPELEEHHIRELLRRSVDGLVVVGDAPEPRDPIAVDSPVPVVYAYAFSSDPSDTSIVCDNVAAGRLAVDHLLSLGRQRLAHLGGVANELAAQERSAGFAEAMASAGREPLFPTPLYGEWSEQWGWDATAQLLDAGLVFDGLVCGDDQIARGAIDQLMSRGLRVPDDVDVIGFDNWAVVSQLSRHPFPSIDMNLNEVGRAAAQALLAADGPRPGIQRIVGHVATRDGTSIVRSTDRAGGTLSGADSVPPLTDEPPLPGHPDDQEDGRRPA